VIPLLFDTININGSFFRHVGGNAGGPLDIIMKNYDLWILVLEIGKMLLDIIEFLCQFFV